MNEREIIMYRVSSFEDRDLIIEYSRSLGHQIRRQSIFDGVRVTSIIGWRNARTKTTMASSLVLASIGLVPVI